MLTITISFSLQHHWRQSCAIPQVETSTLQSIQHWGTTVYAKMDLEMLDSGSFKVDRFLRVLASTIPESGKERSSQRDRLLDVVLSSSRHALKALFVCPPPPDPPLS